MDLNTPTHSGWAVPGILFPEKHGIYFLVVDYLGLNNRKEKTCWLPPRNNDNIDTLEGNEFFASIDLQSRYFQIALKEEN